MRSKRFLENSIKRWLWSGRVAASAVFLLISAVPLAAQYGRPKITKGVTIQQKLNSQIPLDLTFHDESGKTVPLRTYFGEKPVLLSLVYFNCPSLCPMSLHEMVSSMKRVPLQAARDYNVVVVSFDPADTSRTAEITKMKYKAESGGRPGFDAGWHFLTGDQQSISKLTDAVGFRYRYDQSTKQFIHAGGIMVATPEGKVSRYFYGIDYAPADLRMGLVEASKEKIGSPVDYVLLFCFHYDATQGRYSLAIVKLLKIAAALTLLVLAIGLYFLMRNDKNQKPPREALKEVHHAR